MITEAQMRGIAAELVDTYVDVDGAAGNQCWDSQAYINSHYFGLPIINTGGEGRWPGWAGNMVDAFPQSAAIAAAYELVSPDQSCQPGDTLVWGTSYPEWYPKTHVATCVTDPGNGWPLCLSQNSSTARPDLPGYSPESTGPVILQSLPKQGLIGIIRPRDTGSINFESVTTQEDSVTPEQMNELKVFVQACVNDSINKMWDTEGVTQTLVQQVAIRLDKGIVISRAQAEDIVAATTARVLDDVRKQTASLAQTVSSVSVPGAVVDVNAIASQLAPLLNASTADAFIAKLREQLNKA